MNLLDWLCLSLALAFVAFVLVCTAFWADGRWGKRR